MVKRLSLIVLLLLAAAAAHAQTGFADCERSRTTTTLTGPTSGTSAVQLIPLAVGTKIFVCSLTLVNASGTTPTFSLVSGTGTNCGTGQAVFLPAVSLTANVPLIWHRYVGALPAGAALCYLQTGTTPVTNYILVYAQG